MFMMFITILWWTIPFSTDFLWCSKR